MSAKYEIDFKGITELESKLTKIPGMSEQIINEVLQSDGIEIITEEITKLIPVSKRKNRIRNKNHAKNSKWSKSEKHNLAITVKTRGGAAKNRGSFGYLVFPNEGRGPHNLVEQRFMERGLEKATPRIIEKLNERIDRMLKEEL